MNSRVNQSRASAGQNVVAGDMIVNNNTTNISQGNHVHFNSPGIVERLLEKLQNEISANEQVRHTIESLQFFYERRAVDGIVGLEAKLHAGQRDHELDLALAKKEQFAKLLEKWSLYGSAQEIFAYLLASAEHQFSMHVFPKIALFDQTQINQLVDDRIVGPTIAECGTSVFTLNPSLVMGMIYWLAEQCFLRWHP